MAKKAKPISHEEIAEKIEAARVYYKENQIKIVEAARRTGRWLKQNKEFYNSDNIPDDGPWWHGLSDSQNSIIIDLRDFVFRCHLFDNGIRRMSWEMKELNVQKFKGKISREIKFAVSYPAMGLHHELMGYMESSHNTLGLSDLSKRFDLSNHVHLRNRRMVPMSELGMWTCETTPAGYVISLGVPAVEFHRHAFQPLKAAFQARHGRFDPDQVKFPE